MNILEIFLINPIFNVLIAIYQFLAYVHFPGALGFAIIGLTVLIRLTLWPLTTSQLKSSQKMAELKPHMDRIKKEHGHDKIRHQQEISKLYKEHGVNPLAGCLPVIVQIPVILSLYNVLQQIVKFDNADFVATINKHLYFPQINLTAIPQTSFIGFNLASRPNEWQHVGPLILAIPVITGVLQLIQSKMLIAPAVKSLEQAEAAEKKEEKKEQLEDTVTQMQSQMMYLMPAMIAFFSYGFPIGLSLYWNTFTIIGIIQQWKIVGTGSLTPYLPARFQKIKQ